METEEKTTAKEKLKGFWEKTKTALGKVSKVVWIILAAVLVALAVGLVIYFNTRPYSILVTRANPSEMTTVTTWLENRGVTNYRYQGTDTILVPERQAAALKAALLTETYSDGSYDWSGYFDNVSMLSTESERNNAWHIAVQERMALVISQMKGVEAAWVEINPGQDRSYVLDSGNVVEASAAVRVRTRDDKLLDDGVAEAIRSYVSHGVLGLKIDSVDLYDTNGNHYNGITVSNGADADASLLKFQLEEEQKNKIRSEVMNLLVPMYGENNVRTSVNLTIDVSTTEVDETEPYIPDYIDEEHRGKGEGIVVAKAWDYTYKASDDTIAGGLVGAEPNSDIETDVEREPGPNDVSGKVEGGGQKEYNNPERQIHTYRSAGYITDRHVSVSINSKVARDLNLELLRELVANAAGITPVETIGMTTAEFLAGKVTIYVGPFYEEPPIVPNPYPWWPFNDIVPGWVVLVAAAALLLFIILLIVIILLVRSHKKKKQAAAALAEAEAQQAALEESEEERREAEAALAEVMGMPQTELVGADVMSLQTEKSMELRQDIRQFVEENPEVAAQLLKSWLRGGDDRG